MKPLAFLLALLSTSLICVAGCTPEDKPTPGNSATTSPPKTSITPAPLRPYNILSPEQREYLKSLDFNYIELGDTPGIFAPFYYDDSWNMAYLWEYAKIANDQLPVRGNISGPVPPFTLETQNEFGIRLTWIPAKISYINASDESGELIPGHSILSHGKYFISWDNLRVSRNEIPLQFLKERIVPQNQKGLTIITCKPTLMRMSTTDKDEQYGYYNGYDRIFFSLGNTPDIIDSDDPANETPIVSQEHIDHVIKVSQTP